MKRLFAMVLAVSVISGCAAWKEYKRDYLKGDQYNEDVIPDAYKEYKEDYLK